MLVFSKKCLLKEAFFLFYRGDFDSKKFPSYWAITFGLTNYLEMLAFEQCSKCLMSNFLFKFNIFFNL